MPLNRSARLSPRATPAPRRGRPAHPSCRGGVSSLLRVAQPPAQRLPTRQDVADWADPAGGVLMPVTGPLGDFRFQTSQSAEL